MKCQNQFSEKNKKNISMCKLLKILPKVLSVSHMGPDGIYFVSYLMNLKSFFYFILHP